MSKQRVAKVEVVKSREELENDLNEIIIKENESNNKLQSKLGAVDIAGTLMSIMMDYLVVLNCERVAQLKNIPNEFIELILNNVLESKDAFSKEPIIVNNVTLSRYMTFGTKFRDVIAISICSYISEIEIRITNYINANNNIIDAIEIIDDNSEEVDLMILFFEDLVKRGKDTNMSGKDKESTLRSVLSEFIKNVLMKNNSIEDYSRRNSETISNLYNNIASKIIYFLQAIGVAITDFQLFDKGPNQKTTMNGHNLMKLLSGITRPNYIQAVVEIKNILFIKDEHNANKKQHNAITKKIKELDKQEQEKLEKDEKSENSEVKVEENSENSETKVEEKSDNSEIKVEDQKKDENDFTSNIDLFSN